ncbi:MAG: type I-MYXAN CRISPR-associated protein Cas6/Cmx6 [Rhodocyclaceae bacterium]|nr:type I-MYXAN CRISPR-associated protein Cas6/Cmx6 [Rhodocyclaceae bacterium]
MTAHNIDVQFPLRGQSVPVDYADALWLAVRERLPWLMDEEGCGVHPLAWVSPGEGVWYLSGRSRLTLRVPVARLEEVISLAGSQFVVGGHGVTLGAAKTKPLVYAPVLYARFVTFFAPSPSPVGEEAFLEALAEELARLSLAPKFICGRAQRMQTGEGLISGFSLMLYDLPETANLALQHHGLGQQRHRGCGIFVPHKPGSIVSEP